MFDVYAARDATHWVNWGSVCERNDGMLGANGATWERSKNNDNVHYHIIMIYMCVRVLCMCVYEYIYCIGETLKRASGA